MPRRKPSEVIEHRYSLSDYERVQLKEINESLAKATRLNAISRGVSSGGVAALGIGAVGAAVFFGLGYAGMGIRDLFDPVKDWAGNQIDKVAGGHNVEKIQAKLDKARAKREEWAILREDTVLGSPQWIGMSYKIRWYDDYMIPTLEAALVAAEAQQDYAESDIPKGILDVLLP